MAIPNYQSIMLPLLELAGEAEEGTALRLREAVDTLAQRLNLTDDERRERLSSGQLKLYNRVSWAKLGLMRAGLLETSETFKRNHFYITDQGRNVLASNPPKISDKFLMQFEEFKKWKEVVKQSRLSKSKSKPEVSEYTPEENLQVAYSQLREKLAAELLQEIMDSPPEFFERLVVDLLRKMNYGGSGQEVGEAIGRSGDEGVDGVIKQDPLGLEVIYIQAKRWSKESDVGRPEIQKFAGALQGKKARKGVFITTTNFTRVAKEYVGNIDTKIVLIDGTRLAELMIDYGVGVTTEETYKLKRIDSDYFSD